MHIMKGRDCTKRRVGTLWTHAGPTSAGEHWIFASALVESYVSGMKQEFGPIFLLRMHACFCLHDQQRGDPSRYASSEFRGGPAEIPEHDKDCFASSANAACPSCRLWTAFVASPEACQSSDQWCRRREGVTLMLAKGLQEHYLVVPNTANMGLEDWPRLGGTGPRSHACAREHTSSASGRGTR